MSAEQETDQERRITFCLYESWEKIAGSSGLPALKRLQRQEIEAFKSNLVLLDLRNGKDNPIFQVIGNGLTEDLEVDLVGRPIAEVPRRSMLSRVTDHYLEVLANRVPIAFEAEFVNREGEKALYRGILLPFSDDNQNINFILGGVRWILAKDVQLDEDKPTIEELMRTIASGRDEITLENEEDVLNEDQLDATLSQETTDDTLQKRDIAETAVDVKGAIDLEDASFDANSVAKEKVVFDEPPISETSTETTSDEIILTEEVPSELDGVDNDEPEAVAEEVYLEIDETTSFEEDIIEELTAHDEQEEDIKPEELDLSNTIISEPTEEGIEESSLKLENEIHEEISAQEEELLETSVAESNQSNIALETGTDEEKEEITFDVTEAEDIADDATIIEQQVASSEPIITDTSHDISAQKEEKSEEENLRELQDSLKQIIRYIKKEDASHNRSRDSLYNILTAIYKFHSVCENSPVEYSKLVAENGLKIQERAPFTPVLKICLGKDYDKTRLTEYAAALGIAKHMNVDVEDFHDFIKHFPGGIKGCVKEMRAIRKGSNGANLVQQSRTVEEARNVLRDMPVIGRIRLKKMIVSKDADEFCLLLAKRRGHDIDVLKVLDDQYTKIDPILKRTAFINGNLKKEN